MMSAAILGKDSWTGFSGYEADFDPPFAEDIVTLPEFFAVKEPVLKAIVLPKIRNAPPMARLKGQVKSNELGIGGALPVGHFDPRFGEDIITLPEFCAAEEPVLKACVPSKMRNLPSMARLKAMHSCGDVAPQSAKALQHDAWAAKLTEMPPTSSAAVSGSRMEELMAAMGIFELSSRGFLQSKALLTRSASRAALPGGKESPFGQQHMAGPVALSLRNLCDCSRKDVERTMDLVPHSPALPRPVRPSEARPGRRVLSRITSAQQFHD